MQQFLLAKKNEKVKIFFFQNASFSPWKKICLVKFEIRWCWFIPRMFWFIVASVTFRSSQEPANVLWKLVSVWSVFSMFMVYIHIIRASHLVCVCVCKRCVLKRSRRMYRSDFRKSLWLGVWYGATTAAAVSFWSAQPFAARSNVTRVVNAIANAMSHRFVLNGQQKIATSTQHRPPPDGYIIIFWVRKRASECASEKESARSALQLHLMLECNVSLLVAHKMLVSSCYWCILCCKFFVFFVSLPSLPISLRHCFPNDLRAQAVTPCNFVGITAKCSKDAYLAIARMKERKERKKKCFICIVEFKLMSCIRSNPKLF